MPRVKAMTTGSIPSFLDVILNFAESDTTSTLAHQDTWLAQLKAQPGGKLVMYGDDTWLKLFPDTFSRADGTSSFFVSDFTEVDNNVTRHVAAELRRSDWNGMILHYLGLDHIGHKSGPRSPHMAPKQAEMDGIVRQIFEAIESTSHLRSTLLVLSGDHGMNDAGNHGGSAAGETSPALVFISPKLRMISPGSDCPAPRPVNDFQYYNVVEQSDIAPTLAGLLGFPVPLNNLGVCIPEFLRFFETRHDKIRILHHNARQILEVVKKTFAGATFDEQVYPCHWVQSMSDAEMLSCHWSNITRMLEQGNSEDTETVLNAILEFSKKAQGVMSSTASNYDLHRLHLGLGVAAFVTAGAFALSAPFLRSAKQIGVWFGILVLAYGAMMLGSSYVEEEQEFWYWIASAWFGWLYFKAKCIRTQKQTVPGVVVVALSVMLRIMRRWNQTGQKHAGAKDIARTFLPNHTWILWVLVVATYLDLAQRLSRRGLPRASRQVAAVCSISVCLAAFGFKVAFTDADAPELLLGFRRYLLRPMEEASLLTQARTVFLAIALFLSFTILADVFSRPAAASPDGTCAPTTAPRHRIKHRLSGLPWPLHDLLTLFLVTQSRVTNIPLFLLFEVKLHFLGALDLAPGDLTLTSIILQFSSFFALGGSNAISSVDLSNAYNGIGGYNVAAVGILTFISNWAGPLWWMSAMNLLLLQQHRAGRRGVLAWHLTLLTTFTAASLFFVMLACTMLRTHLFIWTVFSPKYLYSMAWSLGQHLCVNVLCGSALFWIGS
ncbi:Type I phosphodiesterase/nucleotide pyrophosphatase/phosphate transferase [Lasallia pustulata]|uniref:GPI ethanolamine phosphate transferase 2 n=1 Tax=Lasallia pustulata TaxID=136370 RepID=A0A1W5CY62_9LECA|nr:Type I phosphodiesterase/nucleotide pyrophosphatase/phosphate transferase [Lasallia pustulata]